MTPKEKAIEIYTKMFDQIFAYYATDNLAKGCAILAVDEILNELDEADDPLYYRSKFKFWIEVKKEIENL
jgi:hypothetical protein